MRNAEPLRMILVIVEDWYGIHSPAAPIEASRNERKTWAPCILLDVFYREMLIGVYMCHPAKSRAQADAADSSSCTICHEPPPFLLSPRLIGNVGLARMTPPFLGASP